jgi:hypothetical protein
LTHDIFFGIHDKFKKPSNAKPTAYFTFVDSKFNELSKSVFTFYTFWQYFFLLKASYCTYAQIDGTRAYRELTLKKKLVDNFFKVNLFSKSGKSFRDLSIQISEVLLKNRYLHQKQQQRFSNFCPKILKNTRFYSALVINSIISKWCSAPSSTDGTTHNTKLF